MAIDSIEGYLPFSTMGIARASDGAVWLLHPPSPGGLVQLEAPTTPEPPVNTVPPTIASDGLTVGSIFSLTPGVWTPSGTITQQWSSAGTPISGATGMEYVAQASDVGHSITCVVTVTNTDGSASATSNALGPITAPADEEVAQAAQQPQAKAKAHHSSQHGKTHHAQRLHR